MREVSQMAKEKKYADDLEDDDIELEDYEDVQIEQLEASTGNSTARRRIEELKEEMYLRKQITDEYLELDSFD